MKAGEILIHNSNEQRAWTFLELYTYVMNDGSSVIGGKDILYHKTLFKLGFWFTSLSFKQYHVYNKNRLIPDTV